MGNGDGTGGGNGMGAGRMFFTANVAPLFMAQRQGGACATCHVTGGAGTPAFLGAPGGDMYQALRQDQFRYLLTGGAASRLATKGPHAGAAYFTPQEVQILVQWINMALDIT